MQDNRRNPLLDASLHLSKWLLVQVEGAEETVDFSKITFDNIAVVSIPKAVLKNSTDINMVSIWNF